ncbi:MAG: DUF1249 domain-containing protein [Methylohalobius sp. ZOD2]|uniref:DUF1249 domain-containing protein n=1 Tax=Methylohalobius crimeensis TaxID=244365 RepID=UPI0003B3D268|nr:DUF1249 domain-containing protein [Methylohalobius crimeensis]MBN2701199.1 DUF1249 domain-containing protein [Methylothermaceae bacterium]
MSQLNPVNKFCCLQEICESNYRKLLRLVPRLSCLERRSVASLGGKPTLHLRLVEKARYTVTLELSYCFQHGPRLLFEPKLVLKAYLDAGMVEVLSDGERPRQALKTPVDREVLEHKWLLNYFLDKWLDHCLYHGYRFAAVDDHSKTVYADV